MKMAVTINMGNSCIIQLSKNTYSHMLKIHRTYQVCGGTDSAVARANHGWKNFRELHPVLTSTVTSVPLKGMRFTRSVHEVL